MTEFDVAVDAYLEALRARRYSRHSLTAYADDLRHLGGMLGDRPLAEVAGHDIRRALASLHGRGYAPKSLARMLSSWRGLFRHLARVGQASGNPCTGIRPPKPAKRLPHALSPDAVAALLDVPQDAPTGAEPWATRDRAMFELLYSSGLRLAELVGLGPGDVDAQAGEVRVTGKGNKQRIVPVGAKALAALAAWQGQRAGLGGDADALFIGARGGRIAPRVVQTRLKQLALARGISQRVHPHALRHSFASHVLQSSGDLRAVQEMLGHASLSTTQVYTHLDFQHLAKVYDAAHPRAKKK
jgi:integrase/recombinase XerC